MLVSAGLLTGCLTPRQTAVVGGSGVALSVVSIVALQPADCDGIVAGDGGGCGRVSFPVGIAAAALAIPLLAGAVINLIAGPVRPPARHEARATPTPSRTVDHASLVAPPE